MSCASFALRRLFIDEALISREFFMYVIDLLFQISFNFFFLRFDIVLKVSRRMLFVAIDAFFVIVYRFAFVEEMFMRTKFAFYIVATNFVDVIVFLTMKALLNSAFFFEIFANSM